MQANINNNLFRREKPMNEAHYRHRKGNVNTATKTRWRKSAAQQPAKKSGFADGIERRDYTHIILHRVQQKLYVRVFPATTRNFNATCWQHI